MTEALLVEEVRPHVALVTLNRPDRLNALSWDLVDELHAALDRLERDNGTRIVVLTGAGRGFCSGLDLQGGGTRGASISEGLSGPAGGMRAQAHIAGLMTHLRRIPQPIIAAVNGAAVGGGLALSLFCDIRVAAESARFGVQFIRVGLSGCDVGVSYALPRLIGGSRAFELMLTGRQFDAAEADRIGLVARVVPDGAVVDAALDIADTMLQHAPFGLVMTKEVMWANLAAPSLEAAIHLENRTQILASQSGDFQEALAAFAEKRAQLQRFVTADALVRVEPGDDGVTVITINRPGRLNALSLPTITALKDAFGTVGSARDTRVVILTGAGPGFCAGLDLKSSGSSPVSEGLHGVAASMRGQAYFADVVEALRAVPQPVIAAVNGVAVGGGFALATGCDLRYAAASARFNVQALRIGLSAGESGLSFHLPRLLAASPAFEWLLTNRFVDAAEAERVGLVARVVPDADLGTVTRSVAADLARHDRDALCLAKATMWANLLAPSLDAAVALEGRAWMLSGGSDDGG